MMTPPDEPRFASRAGHKLAHALERFAIEPAGCVCADLGCNAGGFTDCLLRRGARRVYAVDTGFGALDWKLRRDPRVIVMERTNALHLALPEPVDLVAIDVAWTRQCLILPRAMELVRRDTRSGIDPPDRTFIPPASPTNPVSSTEPPSATIVTLIKPHYEADPGDLRNGRLEPQAASRVVDNVVRRLAELHIVIECVIPSPIPGDGGNHEWLGLIRLEPRPGSGRSAGPAGGAAS